MINNIQDLINEVLWKPSFEWGEKREEYERRWFCEHNKEIHGNLKQVLNCKHCNKMKISGEGFKYWLDDKQLRDFDEFERKTKNIEVKIEIDKLDVRAKTV